ncbi:MAG TPA: hypothetical protein VFJ77_08355 [Gaiellaceae bacterium]|nr:hypothetical protein [Gaiellaceae bacterium]
MVEAAVALGTHADVGAAAAATTDDPGEEELGAVAAPPGQILAPLPEQRLRGLEGGLLDERLVQAGEALAAPVDPAEIRLVLQQPLHHRRLPAPGGRRGVLVGEQPRDRSGPEPVLGIEAENPLHHRCLPLVGDDELVRVAAVAEGDPPRGPAALLRTALDAGGDPVDDRRVLELREHRQHLQHHPPRRRAGVKGFGGGAECDAGPVELLRQLRQLPDLPAEPVDAVDEQQIYLALPGKLQRRV